MAKILIIVPSEKIKEDVDKIIKEHRQNYSYIYPKIDYIDTEIITNTNMNFQGCNADVIVARGMLATKLKKSYPNIPIVEIPITVTDIVRAVGELKIKTPDIGSIALIGLGMVIHQTEAVKKFCGIHVVPLDYQHQPKTPDVIEELFNEAVIRGFGNFIGCSTLFQIASSRGYPAVFINSCHESIWLALTEAQHIAAIRRMERERSARFETILNHSHEGVITTDVNKKIIQINSAAGKILGIDESKATGARIENLIPEPKFMALLSNDREYSNELIKIGKNRIVLNKITTSLGNEDIGNVITFQDVSNVQSTEIKIRSELHRRGLLAKYSFEDILGTSDSLKMTIKKAKTFASVPSNVLIIGETGTGKELFAQSMHNASSRRDAPFVAVNCAAIPENLMESEFFGYAGGAFTGASKEGRMGLFELAHDGTIFLDEVSEIPLNMQSKLLRVIQEGEVMRIGHDKIIPVNVRVICASNRDLKPLTREGNFREDLFYRLAVLQLHLPALRNRASDTVLLADYFIKQYSSVFSIQPKKLTEKARNLLSANYWEGNIRELRNVCEQLVVLNKLNLIDEDEINTVLYPDHKIINNPANHNAVLSKPAAGSLPQDLLRQMERKLIVKILQEEGGSRTATAEALGINRSTLWRKIREHDIDCKILVN